MNDLSLDRARAPRLLSVLVPPTIAACTVFAFWPVLENDFVDWDDRTWLIENYRFRGLGADHLRWMFTTFHEGHYQPLSWVTFGLDYEIWKMDPKGYHLTNLVLHTANAFLFYILALRILRLTLKNAVSGTLMVFGAFIASLLFALHPLRVESVAWATERRDVLCGFFYFLAAWIYLGGMIHGPDSRPGPIRLILVWLFGAAAMGAKSMAVTLPLVLLILNVYPLKRISSDPLRWFSRRARRAWVELFPLIVAALIACVVAIFAGQSAMSSVGDVDLSSRLAITAYGYAFYLYKTVWPGVLLPLYEMPVHLNPYAPRYIICGVALAALSVVLIVLRRRFPGALAAWLCYLVILLPVIGIVQVGPQIVADRYSYLSCTGFALLAGGLLVRTGCALNSSHFRRVLPALFIALALALPTTLAFKTRGQILVWRDSESLWSHVVQFDPGSSRAQNGMGMARYRQGRKDDALDHFRRATEIRPRLLDPYLNIGNILAEGNDLDGAAEHFDRALELSPNHAPAILNRGTIRAAGKDYAGAERDFRAALEAMPDAPQIHYNFGTLLAATGQMGRAADHARIAVRLNPDLAEAWNLLGGIEVAQGNPRAAEESLRRALALNSDDPRANKNLGDALRNQDKNDAAIVHYQRAVQLMPAYGNAHFALGNLLLETGRPAAAVIHFRRAAEIDPDNPTWQQALNRALQTVGAAED